MTTEVLSPKQYKSFLQEKKEKEKSNNVKAPVLAEIHSYMKWSILFFFSLLMLKKVQFIL